MPSELTNQSVRSSGGAAPGGHLEEGAISRLVVLTFEDASQAEGLYEELKELDKKEILNLEDAVFVTKDENGEYKVDEKIHHEKRSGTAKGAVIGVLLGWMLGGPILGLAGGAIVGRVIGKRMDLGIDKNTIDNIAADLEKGHTALFILGSANEVAPVLDVFNNYHGKIVETTLEPDVQEKLQKALDSGND